MKDEDGNVNREDEESLAWASPHCVPKAGNPIHLPTARGGHSATLNGPNLYVFGGLDASTPPGPNNDVFMLRMSTREYEWEKLSTIGRWKPPARWRHTATLIDDTRILIFGGFHSTNERLNDVWVLDVVTLEWYQPNRELQLTSPKASEANKKPPWDNQPSPRAGHSASLLEAKVWVFGGYGGFGFGRRDLDDLYTLRVDNWAWFKVSTKGKAPEKRSNHTSLATDAKLYICGGGNSVQHFRDLYILDTEQDPPVWSHVEESLREFRWSHAAVAVMAIPDWKIFVFGGRTTDVNDDNKQSAFSSDIAILDTGNNRWSYPQLGGTLLPPRCDSAMEFDSKQSRLIVFGGWQGEWLQDVQTLDVGCIVGPPYAITDVYPDVGPITGGTAVEILGIEFVKDDVVVRFSSRKGYVEVKGVYINNGKLTCVTPDFQPYPTATLVEVRVAIGGDSFTTTFGRFTYFPVSAAKYSLIYGPALLEGGATNEEALFYIQARTHENTNRTTGGDEFKVYVTLLANADSESKDVNLGGVMVTDEMTGRYMVTFVPKVPGRYCISVQFLGTFGGQAGEVRGSPAFSTFDDMVSRDMNSMLGANMMGYLKRSLKHLHDFGRSTLTGLLSKLQDESWSQQTATTAIVRVREHIMNVQSGQGDVQLLMDRCWEICEALKAMNIGVAGFEAQLQAAQQTWEQVLKELPNTVTRVTPLVKANGVRMKQEVQQYEEHLRAYVAATHQQAFKTFEIGYVEALAHLERADHGCQEEAKHADEMVHLANCFDCPREMQKSLELMNQVRDMLTEYKELWTLAKEFAGFVDMCRGTSWLRINPEGMEEVAREHMQSLKRLPRNVRDSDAYSGLEKQIRDFLKTCPLVVALRHPAMRDRHWNELMVATGKRIEAPTANPDLKLSDVLALELHNFSMDVEDITEKALKELKQEETLQGLARTWAGIDFQMTAYKDTDVPLVRLSDADAETLDADSLTAQGMATSRYAYFKTQSLAWVKTLTTISEVLQLLADLQRVWSYLEPLFLGSEEIKRELRQDASQFETVDAQVRMLLRQLWFTKNVRNACEQPGLRDQLVELAREQEKSKKKLGSYLDSKGHLFSRFFFMSEGDLLEILSNASSPQKVMKHIMKVMPGTKALELTEQEGGSRPEAVKFISSVGDEEIAFETPVPLEGKVEEYMQAVLTAQIRTLSEHLYRSIRRYPTQLRVDWLMTKQDSRPVDAAQVALLVANMQFVTEVETAMERMAKGEADAMQTYSELQTQQLGALARLTQRELSKADRRRVTCAITMDAHHRDFVIRLISDRAFKRTDFGWQSQLKPRPLMRPGKDASAEFTILDARFIYGFEYLGNASRLVVTPLTNRIYVTATQALHLHMGCAACGPPDTGKSETMKDLAASLGKCYHIVSCSAEMDYQSIGNIIKGLAASGWWGCFQNFNRLPQGVLSVCSIQLKAVFDGKRNCREGMTYEIIINGDGIKLDGSCGIFVSMNVDSLGRSELPEGLKALFRPITIMVPDLVLICEYVLMGEGFADAKRLASKLQALHVLLQHMLSERTHYVWGLRAMKAVLSEAGQLKCKEPDVPEEIVLMRALRNTYKPTIVEADEAVFMDLLNDFFSSVASPQVTDPALASAAVKACQELGLWPDDNFVEKVLQLEELLVIRHCAFLLGHPGSGKSSCWKVLRAAKTLKQPTNKVKVVDLNPNTMSTDELYGHICPATRQWKDGLLPSIMRDLGNVADDKPKWIVLDGDLDAGWAEFLHSVMDDSRVMTLPSNERTPLLPHMRMLFEIRDLRNATPATASRGAVLYIAESAGTQWRSLVASWVQSRPDTVFTEKSRENIRDLFDKYVPNTLDFVQRELRPLVTREVTSIVAMLLRLLQSILSFDVCRNQLFLEHAFVFACIWAFGSTLCVSEDGVDYRSIFSDWWRSNFKSVRVPTRETVFDYWLDVKQAKFDTWKASGMCKPVMFNSREQSMSDVVVPTTESASIGYWVRLLIKNNCPVLLAGPAGSGKTQLVRGIMSEFKAEERIQRTVAMSFYTTAATLQSTLEASLTKRSSATFGPPGSVLLTFFIDDLNLPELDAYNTQSALALLRQHMDYGHWYDRQKHTVKQVVECQYVAAMNPSAGSCQVNPRLQRHFTVFAVDMPSATSLLTIFQTYLEGHLVAQDFEQAIIGTSSTLVKAALATHKEFAETFRKSALKVHYEFNIRQLTNVFQGMLLSTPPHFTHPERLVALWLHETERVYGDRMTTLEDLEKVQAILVNQGKKAFPAYNVQRYYAASNVPPELNIFSHFADGLEDTSAYSTVTDMQKLQETVGHALSAYNETDQVMDLVIFDDVVTHVLRIARVLKQTAGHALLVGAGGIGRQSLTRLAGFMCRCVIKELTMSQSYSVMDFKADLQAIYQQAGVKGEQVALLLNEPYITNERFLVQINAMVASGSVPDLFCKDEQENIISAVLPKVKSSGLSTEPSSCWDFFLNQVRKNLHCVLCLTPEGGKLQSWARKFPSLTHCTTMDWFHPWPKESLQSVAKKLLDGVDLGSHKLRHGVESFMPFSFETTVALCRKYQAAEGRTVHVTPKTYVDMLTNYCSILEKKRREVDEGVARLTIALNQLKTSAETVSFLEKTLASMQALADEKRRITEKIGRDVGAERTKVDIEAEKVAVEAAKLAEVQQDMTAKQTDAETDLKKAEPAVEAAMNALDTLDKKELGACKGMAKPLPGVGDVFAAIVVLLAGVNPSIPIAKNGKVKEKDRSWDSVKKLLLGNVNGFIDELRAYKSHIDEGTVPDVNMKEIRPYLQLEHFTVETIEKRNSSVAGLCAWVINIVSYYEMVLEVEPKRQVLRQAKKQLEAATRAHDNVKARLTDLQAKLDQLTAEYEAAEAEMKTAQETADMGKLNLELARKLVAALGSEEQRWSEALTTMHAQKEVLVGDVLLASAFVSYTGPFSKPYRDELVKTTWIPYMYRAASNEPIPLSPKPEPVKTLVHEALVASWQQHGLPAGGWSSQNGAIVQCSKRWVLMVDPQLHGLRWVRNMEAKRGPNFQVLRSDNPEYVEKLQAAMENGWSVVIEDMDDKVNPVLTPLISKTVVHKGKGVFVRFDCIEVELNPAFRLFMQTKLSNPHFSIHIQAQVTLVNFAVTPQEVEDQLLSLVMKKERPDIAAKQAALTQQANISRVRLKELEDSILSQLSSAAGDVAMDRALIEGLEKPKSTADGVRLKLEQTISAADNLLRVSDKYQSVARRGALLFSVVMDMAEVHPYYMHSLHAFLVFFWNAMDRPPRRSSHTGGGAGGEKAGGVNSAKKRGPQKSGVRASGTFKRSASQEKMDDAEQPVFSWDISALAPASPMTEADIARVIEGGDGVPVTAPNGEEVDRRCKELKESITATIFSHMREGLFERDRLALTAMLAFRIIQEENSATSSLILALTTRSAVADPPPMKEEAKHWMSDAVWARLASLERSGTSANLSDLCEAINLDAEDWSTWCSLATPESERPPGKLTEATDLEKLVILRIVRPDRVPTALRRYLAKTLGESYVYSPPLDLAKLHEQSSKSTPILFVLSHGVDPTPCVEDLGASLGITQANGLYVSISMAQGQEKPAEAALERMAKEGGWVYLQNVHLMQTWLPCLQRQLRTLAETAAPSFRCFMSAEPPTSRAGNNLPESLLLISLKVVNEWAPDLQSNLRRAWSKFSDERLQYSRKRDEYKACLFGLCFYHSLVLGRRRFGPQGWSHPYAFHLGDMLTCAHVVEMYLNDSSGSVPWQELRYILGDIMYGGHIGDFWDRRINSVHLQVLFNESLLTNGKLGPALTAPNPRDYNHKQYLEFIDKQLKDESPSLYGLHHAAEAAHLSSTCESIFETITRSRTGSGSTGQAADSGRQASIASVEELLNRLPRLFNVPELHQRAQAAQQGEHGPYVLVLLRECERMTKLLEEVTQSLIELRKGLSGQLNMSPPMEDLAQVISANEVPSSWAKFAWPSRKALSSWFADLLVRFQQLQGWSRDFQMPISVWFPGLFNPAAFLTAVKQVVVRRNGLALEKVTVETHVTKMIAAEEAVATGSYPLKGVYVHGLSIQGARWQIADEASEAGTEHSVDGVGCSGMLVECSPRSSFVPMPVMYVKAVPALPAWEMTPVGYLRPEADLYNCPVYMTALRGPTYLCLATLKTREARNKWILASVALIMQQDQ